MILGIGTKLIDIRRPKGPTSPPPAPTWYIDLENGSGVMQLETASAPITDLMLLETAP